MSLSCCRGGELELCLGEIRRVCDGEVVGSLMRIGGLKRRLASSVIWF
jgi:hypothetical protein